MSAADNQELLVDERKLYHGQAAAIVAPASVQELSKLMRYCDQKRIAMVPQGGNTGYCGGATPDESGKQVLVCLSRLNQLVQVDRTGLSITVQAGATLEQVQIWADEHDLYFPLAMGSQASCQIGGNLSTNAGGLAVLRYGTARELVLGLQVVLADGRVLSELEGLRKNNTGYPLAQLFCGAEGTLGIITAATLRLFPKPVNRLTLFVALPGIDRIAELLLAARIGSGDSVVSFEYISRASLEFAMDCFGYSDPLNEAVEHYALIELASSGALDALQGWLDGAMEDWFEEEMISDGVIASSEAQRRALWLLRERIPAAERQLGGSIKHDVSVIPSALPALLKSIRTQMNAHHPQLRLSVYGHVGDGNLHVNALAPAEDTSDDFVARMGKDVSRLVHDCTAGFQGSFSAEHGIGKYKAADLQHYADPVRLDLMRVIKQALDPKGLMNPGKMFVESEIQGES